MEDFDHLDGIAEPIETARGIARQALQTDGGHHKQFALEEILVLLGDRNWVEENREEVYEAGTP